MGQLQAVGEQAKKIIVPWVVKHGDEEIAGLNASNARMVKERFAKIEDLELCLLHYKERSEILRLIERFANEDARKNKKIPGVKVLVREVPQN